MPRATLKPLSRTGVRAGMRSDVVPDYGLCGSSREAPRARCGRAVRRRTDSMTPLRTKGVIEKMLGHKSARAIVTE